MSCSLNQNTIRSCFLMRLLLSACLLAALLPQVAAAEFTVSLSGGQNCSEGDGPVTYMITRTGDTSQAATIYVSRADNGTADWADVTTSPALDGDDRIAVQLAAGADSGSFTVTPNDDAVSEGFENLVLWFAPGTLPMDALVGNGATHLNIEDNDQTEAWINITRRRYGDGGVEAFGRIDFGVRPPSALAVLSVRLKWPGSSRIVELEHSEDGGWYGGDWRMFGSDLVPLSQALQLFPSGTYTFEIEVQGQSQPVLVTQTHDNAIPFPDFPQITAPADLSVLGANLTPTITWTGTDPGWCELLNQGRVSEVDWEGQIDLERNGTPGGTTTVGAGVLTSKRSYAIGPVAYGIGNSFLRSQTLIRVVTGTGDTNYQPPANTHRPVQVTTDPASGERYLIGRLRPQNRDVDPTAGIDLRQGGQASISVTKLNADGSYVWCRIIGGAGNQADLLTGARAEASASVLAGGVLYVLGIAEGSGLGAGMAGTGSIDCGATNRLIVAAFDAFTGNTLPGFGSNGVVVVDVPGHAVMAGGICAGATGKIMVSGTVLSEHAGQHDTADAVVARISASTGALDLGFRSGFGWVRFGGTDRDYAGSQLAFDSVANRTYLPVNLFSDDAGFGGSGLIGHGGAVVAIDVAGQPAVAWSGDGVLTMTAADIWVDGVAATLEGPAISGAFAGSLVIDGGPGIAGAGNGDAFVVVRRGDGNASSGFGPAKVLGTSGDDNPDSAARVQMIGTNLFVSTTRNDVAHGPYAIDGAFYALNPINGSLVTTFGDNGMVLAAGNEYTEGFHVAELPGNRLLLVGITGASGLLVSDVGIPNTGITVLGNEESFLVAVDRTTGLSGTNAAPAIIAGPYDAALFVGQALHLSVQASGHPRPTYQWFHNNFPINGATFATYDISSVALPHAGTYRCEATNVVGGPVSSSTATVTVEAGSAPVITDQPDSLARAEGQSASFTVVATGAPQPTYAWYKDGEPIPLGAGQEFGPTYTISSVNLGDAGSYTCVVSNGIGAPATSDAAVLTVNEAVEPIVIAWPTTGAEIPTTGLRSIVVKTDVNVADVEVHIDGQRVPYEGWSRDGGTVWEFKIGRDMPTLTLGEHELVATSRSATGGAGNLIATSSTVSIMAVEPAGRYVVEPLFAPSGFTRAKPTGVSAAGLVVGHYENHVGNAVLDAKAFWYDGVTGVLTEADHASMQLVLGLGSAIVSTQIDGITPDGTAVGLAWTGSATAVPSTLSAVLWTRTAAGQFRNVGVIVPQQSWPHDDLDGRPYVQIDAARNIAGFTVTAEPTIERVTDEPNFEAAAWSWNGTDYTAMPNLHSGLAALAGGQPYISVSSGAVGGHLYGTIVIESSPAGTPRYRAFHQPLPTGTPALLPWDEASGPTFAGAPRSDGWGIFTAETVGSEDGLTFVWNPAQPGEISQIRGFGASGILSYENGFTVGDLLVGTAHPANGSAQHGLLVRPGQPAEAVEHLIHPSQSYVQWEDDRLSDLNEVRAASAVQGDGYPAWLVANGHQFINDAPEIGLVLRANRPPTCSLGLSVASIAQGQPVTLTATATDDGDARCLERGIAKVEFYDGATKLGEDTSYPYIFVLNPSVIGTHPLTAKATDICGAVTTSPAQDLTVTVPVNDPPIITQGAVLTTAAILEDSGSVVIGLSALDVDSLTWTVGPRALGGSVSAGGGSGPMFSFTYTPAADRFGNETFTVTVSDGTASDSIAITVPITGVNDAPNFARGTAQTVLEDAGAQTVANWASAISSGPFESDPLVFNIHSNSNPGLFQAGPALSAGGTLTYTPAANANGSATIEVTLSDGVATTVPQAFAITVTAVNDQPSATVATPPAVDEDSGAHTLAGFATALEDGDPELTQTVTAVVSSTNSSLFAVAPALSGGDLTYTLAADANGSSLITVRVSDGTPAYDMLYTRTLTVNALNDAPVNTVLPQISGTQAVGQAQTASTGTWNDLKDQASPVFAYAYQWEKADSAVGANAAAIGGNTSNYTLQPGDAWVRVTVTATDNGIGTPATLSAVAVSPWRRGDNAAPTITPVATVAAVEDGGAVTINLSGNDADTPAAGWVWTIDVVGTKGVCSDPVDGASTSSFTYTPNANAFGSDSVTVRLADGDGASTTQVIAISIAPVNDVPVFAKGGDQSVLEDAVAQTVVDWATSISSGPGESDMLSFTVTNNNTALFSAQPAIAADGALRYTPAADANGSATVTVSLHDDGGTSDGGVDTSAVQTFTITVTAVNDPPSATVASLPAVFEDAAAQTVAGFVSVLADGDPELSQLITTSIVASTGMFTSGPTLSGGDLTYTLAPDVHGSTTITVIVSDGTAAQDVTYSRTLNIAPVNDAPAFTKGSDRAVAHDAGAQTIPAWATGISTGPNDGVQTLTFAVTAAETALFSVQPAIAADGTLSFTPAIGACGSTTVTVTLHDDGGTADGGVDTSAAQAFTITVNRGPVFTTPASAIAVAGTHGSPVTLTVAVSGQPTPTLQWRRNGAVLTGETGSSLGLTGDVADDGAVYTCVAINSGGSTVSPAITLAISGVLPVFTTSPVAHSAAYNATTTFTAAASGQPAPTLQWLRNGVPIGGATGGILTITALAADDGALYACRASNIAGSVTSAGAALTVTGLAAPAVGTPVQNPSPAAVGGSATFSVAPTGTPAPTCQWQRSDGGAAFADVAGATGTALVLLNAQASPVVQVRCVVSNAAGSATSAAATMAVASGPTITTQPADQTVAAGAIASFAVGSDGDAWQWQELAGGVWSDVADTDAALDVTTVLADNGKRYRCLVSKGGIVLPTRAALLTISGVAVTITGQPANVTADLDQVVTFSVTAAGTAPFSYQWKRADILSATTFVAIPGATGPSLTLKAQAGDNGDRFLCVVDNAATTDPGVVSAEAVLTLNVAVPVITDPVAATTVELGLSADLSVSATGIPAATFAWEHSADGVTDWAPVSDPDTHEPVTTPTLSVTPSVLGASYFRCTATNAVGSDVSAVALVTAVAQAPQILDQPAPVLAVAGSPAVLRVRASGLPAPSYQWERAENGGAFSTMAGETSAVLAFTAAAGDDTDRFRCVVTNAGGSVTSAEAVVAVQPMAIAPVITAQPTIAGAVDIGDTVILALTATGTPSPAYQWKRNTVDLPGEAFPVLRLTATYDDDGASYTCLVSNSAGSATSIAVVLEVNPEAPVITGQPTGLAVAAGKPFTLSVTATGTPTPTYQWKRGVSDIPGATAATLEILRPALADAGSYTCVATNAGGSATSTAAVVSIELNAFPLLGQLVDTATGLTVPATPWHWQLAAGELQRWDGTGYQPVGASETLADGGAYFLSGTTDPVLRAGFAVTPFSVPPPVQLEDDEWTPVTVIAGEINIDGTPTTPLALVNDPDTDVVIWYVDPSTGQQVMVGDPEEIFGASDDAVPAGATLWIITNDAPALAPSAGG